VLDSLAARGWVSAPPGSRRLRQWQSVLRTNMPRSGAGAAGVCP